MNDDFHLPAAAPEDLARMFHELYERLAPDYGYRTRAASAVPWEDVPVPNKALMVAVAARVGAAYRAQIAAGLRDAAQAITTSRGENNDPLAAAIWRECERDPDVPAVRDDPRTIAEVAYRHLADRLDPAQQDAGGGGQ